MKVLLEKKNYCGNEKERNNKNGRGEGYKCRDENKHGFAIHHYL